MMRRLLGIVLLAFAASAAIVGQQTAPRVPRNSAEFDELFQKFREAHMQLIHRTIGFAAKSLKGRPVEILEEGMRHKFFPELWEIRCHMTDKWGAEYGVKRDPIGGHH